MGQLTLTTAQTQALLDDVPDKEPGDANIQGHIASVSNPHATNYTPYISYISGVLENGETLTAILIGTWTAASYQWQRDGLDISGETSSTYIVTPFDSLAVITCEVSGLSNVADGLTMPEIYNPIVGFPDFVQLSGDNDLIIRAAMTSNSSSEDTGAGALVAQAGDLATFTADGIDPNNGPGWKIPDLELALATELRDGFTLSYDIDSAWLATDNTILADEYAMGHFGGYLRRKTQNNIHVLFDYNSTTGVALFICIDEKAAKTNVTIVCDATHMNVYFDGLLCQRSVRVRNGADQYQKWTVGGHQALSSGHDGFRLKNAILLSRIQSFPESAIKVGLLGTSLYAGSGPAAFFADSDNDIAWHPGNGYAADGTTPVVGSTSYVEAQTGRMDTGAICQIFRALSNAGHWTTGNSNRSQSGGLIQDAITQFANMLATDLVSPDIVYINLGTNEANAGTAMGNGQFDADYKELLIDLNDAGVTYVIMQEVLSLENDPAFANQGRRDVVSGYNTVINSLPAWAATNTNLTIVVDPIFNVFGGHTPDTTLFLTNNLHPNVKGSAKLGVSAGILGAGLL